MANNKIYANFLMHGRTKGSRNGISTTKGYTAVGQKAKGKIINGRWYYNITPDYVKAENAAKVKARNYAKSHGYDWGENTFNYVTNPDIKSQNAANVKSRAAAIDKKYGYKQMASQAASQEWRDKQERAESEAKKKMYSQAANAEQDTLARRNSVAKGAANNWQQQAALAQLRKQNQNNVAAKKKAQQAYDSAAKGAANNWQQQAAYQQQKDAVRNRAAASAAKGAKNDWQNRASEEAAWKSQMNRYNSDLSSSLPGTDINANNSRYWAEKEAELKRMVRVQDRNGFSVSEESYRPQKNAMKGDPRYTSNKPGPLNTSRDPKYGYSGKNDSRAPVFKEITMVDMWGNKTGGKETPMNRDPYFESWAKATNKQETAKAQAGNKAFMNAFEESKKRNSRSDIGNAVADFKEEAKAKAKSLFKKKKKKK